MNASRGSRSWALWGIALASAGCASTSSERTGGIQPFDDAGEDTRSRDASPSVPNTAEGGEAGNAEAGNAEAGNAEAGNAEAGNAEAGCSLAFDYCEFYTPFACSDGTVSAIVDPCEVCGPAHWVFAHHCQRGCRTDLGELLDAEYTNFGSPTELCEENRSKKQGDPCTTNTDCTPTTVDYLNGAYVPQAYLGCDGTQCVSVSPPVIPDWLTGSSCEPPGAPSDLQVVASDACATKLCLLAAETGDCRPQTCTALCTGDQDCPVGSMCGYLPNAVRACKPGYANNDYSELPCPRGSVDAGG